jgi:hypothetical protein
MMRPAATESAGQLAANLACWLPFPCSRTTGSMSQDHGDQLDQQLLFEVIENQLADGYPLKVKATLMRLCMTGHSREDALELIACALAPEMFAVIEQQQEFNLARYEAQLDLLPQTPWIEPD